MVRSVGLALSAVASARQQRFAEARAFLARVQEDEVRPRVLEGDRPTLDELAQALVDLAQNGAEALDSARALHQRVAAAGRLPLVSARVAAQLLEQALQEQTSS